MEKRIALLALILIVVGVCSPVVIALPPMGPPRATLQEGQWAFGLEYGHNEMDLQTFGTIKETQLSPYLVRVNSYTEYKIENLQSNMFLGRIGAGVWENWDLFVRFGAIDAQDDITEELATGALGDQYTDFDSSSGFIWGFGTRTTFYQEADTTWGGLLQITWASPDGSDIIDKGDASFTGDAEIDYWEVQIAIGPTVEFDSFRLYGGPFLHFVNGDLEISGKAVDSVTPGGPYDIMVEAEHDIREESQLGGYVGTQIYLDENSSLFTEIQFTDDAWGAGVGITWRF